jgi:hypothetical protein
MRIHAVTIMRFLQVMYSRMWRGVAGSHGLRATVGFH